MTGAVTLVAGQRRLNGPGWSLRAERVEVGDDGSWRAVIRVRDGLMLLVTGIPEGGAAEVAEVAEVAVEAWAGEPGSSRGVAVTGDDDAGAELALVPDCGCGEPGCAGNGIQFGKTLNGGDLAALVGVLGRLPWSGEAATRERVLTGDGLAAVPGLAAGADGASYAYSPLTGAFWHPRH
jgi:hypothetical protein